MSRLPGISLILFFGAMVCSQACGTSSGGYIKSLAAAEDARRKRDFDAERRHFDEAATHARNTDDRVEALYRKAHTWLRQGEVQKAAEEFTSLAAQFSTSERAARCLLDAGRAYERLEIEGKALARYRQVFELYPASGSALTASRRIVAIESRGLNSKQQQEYKALIAANTERSLDAALRFYLAQVMEEASLQQALLVYERLAADHPLPQSSYSDDALLRAAQIRRKLGDFQGALELLQHLSQFDTQPAILGSYTRAAYVESYFLRGLILRDDLNQPEDAKRLFESLFKHHPSSRLADDALWQIVVTCHHNGQNACPAMKNLAEIFPDSRYTKCTSLFCAESHTTPDDPKVDETRQLACKTWLMSKASTNKK